MITVAAETPQIAAEVCRAASVAKPFLATCGLAQIRAVTIEVKDRIESAAEHCAGAYYTGTDRLAVIPLARVPATIPPESIFARIDAQTYHKALILHELAHAFMDQQDHVLARCTAEREYVAYALQIGSLPDDARQLLLHGSRVTGPVPPERLNDLVLGMRPDRFATLAWTHFRTPGNGCDFVERLIRGEATLALPVLP